MKRHRRSVRAAIPIAALAGVLVLAGPAAAHVQVRSDTPQALASDAVVAFDAEGESPSSGIERIRVVLPAGLAPADVQLADGPKGWALTATEDGYSVGGPALAPGKSAEYRIKAKRLPDARELVFKSLVTYADGHIDRWIELPQAGTKPAHPAPVLALTPAATPSAPPSVPASTDPATPAAAPVAAADNGSSGDGPVVIGLVAALVVLVGAVVWWRRRTPDSHP